MSSWLELLVQTLVWPVTSVPLCTRIVHTLCTRTHACGRLLEGRGQERDAVGTPS